MYFVSISIVLLFLVFTQAWKFTKDIPYVIKQFRIDKPKGIKYSWCGCGVQREGMRGVWDGFGHVATNESGIYYWSFGIPHLFIPWGKLSLSETKRIFGLRKYNFLKVDGYPNFTWLLPYNVKLNLKEGDNKVL